MFSALQLLDMQLLNDVVLIVWKKWIWQWYISESTAESSDRTICNPCVPHTIIFKCIGAARDPITLRTARDRMATPFQLEWGQCEIGKWSKIGYVVSDVLDEVHAAISANP